MKSLIATLALLAALAGARAGDSTASRPAAPHRTLERLLEGNARYVSESSAHPHQNAARRHELATGQNPVVVILACADSRVSPEVIFDQGLGDLFVVRNAGNVLDDHTLGSIEYAVEHLHVGLVLVVGHENCGAAKATLDGGHAAGHIQSLVEAIQPSLAAAKAQAGDKLDNLVRANARRVASQLEKCEPILSHAAEAGHLAVIAARYDLDSGKVEVLNDEKRQIVK